jgi:LytR cell envelope-related transcriptional attenuator
MPLHLAFSASHFVDKAGNIGGFAAIVGLAVLALLYFSQARELKRLREWAAEAPDRAAELEQRLMTSVRRAAPQQPARAAVARPATPAGASLRPAPAPSAPVGVGAPALVSATRFPGLVPARPAPAPVAAPAPAAVPAVAQAGGGGTTTAAPPVPATSNGRSGDATAITPPPPPAGAPPPERRSVQIRGQAAPLRAGGPAAATPRKKADPHGRRWAVLVGIGVVVIVALVALLVTGALGGGGGGKAKSAGSSNGASTAAPAKKTKAKTKAKPTPFVRRNTTVSVINGTFATGIAAQTESQLHAKGFGSGVASTGADQTHSATVIYYQPGHKRDAQEVKRVLGQGAVEPIGGRNPAASVCAVKQGQPNPCGTGVDVVVVVGSDRTQ